MKNKELEELNKQIEEELLNDNQIHKNEPNSSNMNKPRAIFLCIVLLMCFISFIKMFM
ncbi:hypothetical protein RNS32_03710 [Staphylococcus pseudintermedius]|uniref:hypothetical protein n=1 Tax=Staphylococcus pseudintermedius TaxID=283734 RepID=UPI00129E6A7A|nr:hypothetical protein [Staphylococcus pseudintermedius]EGQ0308030.1 hypothetical protein [Staphylococcus pseudintermedius]EGQ0317399.1 hypothetical protein [Staphylococcus pseudintermedius]EGQ0329623.1 hypothetical protein [Staphylococcus pseudintermedius]EGQ0331881.1 hypothetical protein [Staphylococcus pseudintermedius]EGQ2674366.1 hypothetical protein [Staphylococcus pseudintermedius]